MNRFASLAIASLAAVLVTAGGSSLSAQTTAPPGDAKHGQQLFNVNGCYLCHNYQGQGTGSRRPGQNPGPNLAPGPISYAAYVKQLRTPRVSMPPYDAHLLSDRDLADIYAFLLAQPPNKDAHSIALLNVVNTGTTTGASSPLAHGSEVYAANCAACHGVSGQGGVGPSLKGESARKDTNAVISFIKNPVAPMPTLYPGVLNENDVAAVAAYVESLQ
jgi:ubiquinol-cytochrome c reductase cytochrome c subunit